jgi:hypothetical protein
MNSKVIRDYVNGLDADTLRIVLIHTLEMNLLSDIDRKSMQAKLTEAIVERSLLSEFFTHGELKFDYKQYSLDCSPSIITEGSSALSKWLFPKSYPYMDSLHSYLINTAAEYSAAEGFYSVTIRDCKRHVYIQPKTSPIELHLIICINQGD